MSKSGYRFSGWTGLPKTMPDQDVVVTGSYTKTDIYNPPPVEVKIPTGLNGIDHIAYIIGRNGLAKPNATITRAEVASIFFRLLTDEMRQTYLTSTSSFSDVKAGDWYNTMNFGIHVTASCSRRNRHRNSEFDEIAFGSTAQFAADAFRAVLP